jgi:hypothetical protein
MSLPVPSLSRRSNDRRCLDGESDSKIPLDREARKVDKRVISFDNDWIMEVVFGTIR